MPERDDMGDALIGHDLLDSDAVVVLDEVVLPAEQVEEWQRLWRDGYLPAAQDRGLRLRGLWRGWTEDPAHVCVVVCWSLPRIGGYWVARWSASEEPAVAEFWRLTDEIAVSRRRTSLENVLPDLGEVSA